MKRYIIVLLALCTVALCFCGCQRDELSSTPSTTTAPTTTTVPSTTTAPTATTTTTDPVPHYSWLYVDHSIYRTPAELVEASDRVFLGTVTNISFAILDPETGKIADPSANGHRFNYQDLYTIYEIQVNTVYKGTEQETVYLAIQCGIEDYRVEEQIQLLESYGLPPWIVLGANPQCIIGEEYLFTVTDDDWEDYLSGTTYSQVAFHNDAKNKRWHPFYKKILAYFEQGAEE